jgi:anaerobic selenocysteine-containing dehydrogenase
MEKLGAEFRFAPLRDHFRFAPLRDHGTDTVETIKQMHEGKISFFLGMGGNFLAASPDTEYTAKALQKCRVTAHVSTKLNRSHLITGEVALILPCLGRSEVDCQETGEQFVTVEDSMGVISASRGHAEPASERLMSEPAIVGRLAQATLGKVSSVTTIAFAITSTMLFPVLRTSMPGYARTSSTCPTMRATNANSIRRQARLNSLFRN